MQDTSGAQMNFRCIIYYLYASCIKFPLTIFLGWKSKKDDCIAIVFFIYFVASSRSLSNVFRSSFERGASSVSSFSFAVRSAASSLSIGFVIFPFPLMYSRNASVANLHPQNGEQVKKCKCVLDNIAKFLYN